MPSFHGNITERENLLLRRALDPASSPAEAAKAMQAFAESLRKRGLNGYDFVPPDSPRAQPQPPPPPPKPQPPPYCFYRHSDGTYWPFPEPPKPPPPPPKPPRQETGPPRHPMEPQEFQKQYKAPAFPELAQAWDEIMTPLTIILGIVATVLFFVYCAVHNYAIN